MEESRVGLWKQKNIFINGRTEMSPFILLPSLFPVSQLNLSWNKNFKAREQHVHVKLRHFNIGISLFKMLDSILQKWLERTPGLEPKDFHFWMKYKDAVENYLSETFYEPAKVRSIYQPFQIHARNMCLIFPGEQ